jgi:hypothetical protein
MTYYTQNGYNLDRDGRRLDLKYCSSVDCGTENGGLIRYSEETGEPLPLIEMLNKNNYEIEIADWLAGIYNVVYGGYITCYDGMLYIHDQSKTYTFDNFTSDFHDILENIFIHCIDDFVSRVEDENLDILSDTTKHSPRNYGHCLCVIDIRDYNDETDAHEILNEGKGKYRQKIKSCHCDKRYELDVSFVFISRFLPAQTKIGSIYDKYILIVTTEMLKLLDIAKMWRKLKGT